MYVKVTVRSCFCIYILLLVSCSYAQNVTVTTRLGTIVGLTGSVYFNQTPLVVTKFLGIPFAEPPVGSLRLSKPVPKSPFNGTLVADTMPPACIQNTEMIKSYNVTIVSSEDCLYLNIFLPGDRIDKRNKKPVMIWIYGGGFQVGQQDPYGSLAFAPLNDVVFVTINYRISVLGFLSSGDHTLPGNYGLWDQHIAIQWVHDNIEHFGGDPTNVLIFGQSAGSGSVVYQALYEGNRGLFTKVVAESGTANNPWAYELTPNTVFTNFTSNVGCSRKTRSQSIDCLRSLPVREFERIISQYSEMWFLPVIDNEFIRMKPTDIMLNTTEEAWKILKEFGKVDFIFGFNTAEGLGLMPPIEKSMTESGGDPSKGYTLKMFKNHVIPYLFSVLHEQETVSLREAILQQYIDWNNPSGDPMVLKQTTLELLSDFYFTSGVIRAINAHSNTGEGGRSYLYVFDHEPSVFPHGWWKGALHGTEMNFVLGFPTTFLNNYIGNFSDDPASEMPTPEVQLSRQMMTYWANFAKTG